MFTPFEVPVDGGPAVFAAAIPPALDERDVFEWLSAEDAALLARIGSRRRRAQFAAGRWLLRYAAARAFGGAEYAVRTQGGRPLVTVSGEPAAVSVSHSCDMVVCAAGRVAALGVDVERIRPRRGWEALAAAVLHPQERSALERAPGAEHWRRFYQAWTCKEAIAKALGVGVFGLSLARIRIDGGRVLEAPPEELPDAPAWRLRALAVHEAMAAAVAWRT
jgi:phosphopantetheinyl transferase